MIESGSPGLDNKPEREIRHKHDAELARRLEQGNMVGFLNEWYNQPIFTTIRENPSLFDTMLRSRLQNNPLGLARSLREMGIAIQPNLWPQLSTGRSPLLLLVGQEDKKFRDIADKIIQSYPDSQLIELEGCSHNVHLEAPELFSEAIRTFLFDLL